MYNVFCFADDVEDVNSMEKVMIEYAAMDRELNHYMRAIEETVNQVNCHLCWSYESMSLFKHYLLIDTNVTLK